MKEQGILTFKSFHIKAKGDLKGIYSFNIYSINVFQVKLKIFIFLTLVLKGNFFKILKCA